jgi:hypothetical protein
MMAITDIAEEFLHIIEECTGVEEDIEECTGVEEDIEECTGVENILDQF